MRRYPDPIVLLFISNILSNKDLIPLVAQGKMLDDMTPEQRAYLHIKYEHFCELLTEEKIRNM